MPKADWPIARQISKSVSKSHGFPSCLYAVDGEANAFAYEFGRASARHGRIIQAEIRGKRGTAVAFMRETSLPSAGLRIRQFRND